MAVVAILGALAAFASPAAAIAKEIAGARRAAEAAKTDEERLRHEERMQRLLNLRDGIIAQRSSLLGRIPVALCEGAVAIYIAKLLVWDKVLKLGATDPLTGDLSQWFWIILGGMFAHDVYDRVSAASRIRAASRGVL